MTKVSNSKSQVYQSLLTIAGLSGWVAGIFWISTSCSAKSQLTIVALVPLIILSGSLLQHFRPPSGRKFIRNTLTFTPVDALVLLVMSWQGPHPAAFLAAIEGFTSSRRTTRNLKSNLFSSAMMAVTSWAAYAAFSTVMRFGFGEAVITSNHNLLAVSVALLASSVVQLLANVTVLGVLFGLRQKNSIVGHIKQLLWAGPMFLPNGAAATLMYLALQQHALVVCVIAAPILMAIYLGHRQYRDSVQKRLEVMESLEDLLDNANDLVQSVLPEGSFVYVNRAWLETLGYDEQDIRRLSILDIAAPDSEIDWLDLLRRAAEGEKVGHIETTLVSKTGQTIIVEGNINRSTMEGQPVALRSILRDVTERRRTEEALRSSEQQFRQSQKMEAIGRLAGGVSHDFNNLLTAINGYAQLLMTAIDERDPILDYAREIKKAGDRAASLTRQLLAFSRKQVLQPKMLDLNDIVADMNKMLRRLIGEDINLTTSTGKKLGSVKADPGQLEQVILNLAVNARDAMPNGGNLIIETASVDLELGIESRSLDLPPGTYVMLIVSDTGMGMDPEVRSHIFEPFFTTKGPTQGTGLGLSTVYGIINQSGGQIVVESEIGRGTSFKIYLPRFDESFEPAQVAAPILNSSTGDETILLVEDEEAVRRLTMQILKAAGYETITASNAEEATMVANEAKQPIHLMLTDIVMPGMTGWDLAERIERSSPDTKVIFMSGYTDEKVFNQGLLDPATNFIQKPFSPAVLLQKVREVLDSPKPCVNLAAREAGTQAAET